MKKSATVTPRSRSTVVEEAELPVHAGWAAGAYLLLSVVYFLPAFLPGRGIFGTDYLAGSYAFYEFIAQRFAAGTLPAWAPYIFGGLPHFSNPASTFHPAHLLGELLLPTSRVLPAIYVIQFTLAGIGAYLLARELRCRPWIALLAGLAFQFTGVTLSWVYAGHDGRIMVTTMAPLFLYFLHRGVRTASPAPFAGAAATLALAMLSFQIQNAYYLILAGAIWGVFLLVGERARPRGELARIAAMGVAAVALAFVINAVNFLPFLQYMPEAQRGQAGGRGYEFSVSYSMPPADLLGLAVPEQSGATIYEIDPRTGGAVRALFPEYRGPNPMKLHTEYVGAFVLLLLALGGYLARRDRYWLFFGGLALFALTLALGGHTPLYRLYYAFLPGIRQFRAPDLAFYVAALSLVMMAALTLERMALQRQAAAPRRAGRVETAGGSDRTLWIVGGVLAAALLGALLAGSGEPPAPGEPARAAGWWRFLLFAAAIGGTLWAWSARRLTSVVAALLLALLTTADLWVVGKRFLHTVPPPEEMFRPDDVAEFLMRLPQPERVWNFPGAPHRRDDSFLMKFGVHLAGGEHPNPLQRWNEYVGAGEHTFRDWSNLAGNLAFMHAANVRYLVVAAEIEEPWLREVHRGSAMIYENVGALPRAYLVPEAVPVAEGEALARMRTGEWDPRQTAFVEGGAALPPGAGPLEGEAAIQLYEPDRVRIHTRASRPALLVLADNQSGGWRARVDGAPAEILTANHTFRAVAVPEGESVVEFEFRPAALYTGLYVYLGGWLILALYGGFLLARRLRARAPASAPRG